MPSSSHHEQRSDGAVTRLLLALIAIGASLMLLSGAVLPVADGEASLGFDLLVSSIQKLRELLGA